MYEHDYIMRLTKDYARVLARLFLRLRNEPLGSVVELDDLSLQLVGVPLETLRCNNAIEILKSFSERGILDVNRAYVAGRLLQADAQLQRERGEDALSLETATKALHLLARVAIGFDGFLNDEHEKSFAELQERLEDETLEPKLYELVIRAYRDAGQYPEAERVVMRGMAADSRAHYLAEDFYSDLLRRSDDELRRGGFSRAHIHRAMQAQGIPLLD